MAVKLTNCRRKKLKYTDCCANLTPNIVAFGINHKIMRIGGIRDVTDEKLKQHNAPNNSRSAAIITKVAKTEGNDEHQRRDFALGHTRRICANVCSRAATHTIEITINYVRERVFLIIYTY